MQIFLSVGNLDNGNQSRQCIVMTYIETEKNKKMFINQAELAPWVLHQLDLVRALAVLERVQTRRHAVPSTSQVPGPEEGRGSKRSPVKTQHTSGTGTFFGKWSIFFGWLHRLLPYISNTQSGGQACLRKCSP